ncbi:DoxX family protein [Actinacidiphila glaucinigra]|uniref:DoxX family protein n=1 Tax=Actinacidiphila glaucinigra TaxID=235986 RepID=UPI003711286F
MRAPIIALTIILVSVLGALAVTKLTGQVQMRDRMAHLGVSSGLTRLIGVVEVAAIVGLLTGLVWPPLGVAAAVGLVMQLTGAAIFHARAKDPVPVAAVPVVFAVAATALAVLHVIGD